MRTHENQITDYPKGARIEAIREIPLCSLTQNYYADPLPQGTRGTVTAHTDNGRAWINFDGQGQGLLGHTFEQPEKYIRVVCTHRDDNCPANHEQPNKTEFDQVFDQIEAPEYPATCDNCGFEAANEYMDEHICDPSDDTSAAPERGEWRYFETRYSAEVAVNDNLQLRAHWTGTWDRDEIRTLMQGVVTEHNQHSTLITQRERLIQILQAACSTLKSYQYGNVSPALAKEMIRTIEQVITTSKQEGRRER